MLSALSEKRLTPYLAQSHNDPEQALQLYLWNARLSAALFYHIHLVEITLRNTIDNALRKHFNKNWVSIIGAKHNKDRPFEFRDVKKQDYIKRNAEADKLNLARKNAMKKRQLSSKEVSDNAIISTAPMGLWVGLLRSKYRQCLWDPYLRHSFSTKNQIEIYSQVLAISDLRNKIAHHEAIIFNENDGLQGYFFLLHYKKKMIHFVSRINKDLANRMSDGCEYDSILDEYFDLRGIDDNNIVAAQVKRFRNKDHYAQLQTLEGLDCRCNRQMISFLDKSATQPTSILPARSEVICVIDRQQKPVMVTEILDIWEPAVRAP